MEEKKHRLVIQGNSVYELDLECIRKKKERENEKLSKNNNKKTDAWKKAEG